MPYHSYGKKTKRKCKQNTKVKSNQERIAYERDNLEISERSSVARPTCYSLLLTTTRPPPPPLPSDFLLTFDWRLFSLISSGKDAGEEVLLSLRRRSWAHIFTSAAQMTGLNKDKESKRGIQVGTLYRDKIFFISSSLFMLQKSTH